MAMGPMGGGMGPQGMAVLMAALRRGQPGAGAAPGAAPAAPVGTGMESPGMLNRMFAGFGGPPGASPMGMPGGTGGLDGMPGAPNGAVIPGMPMNLNPLGRGMGMLGGGAPGPGAGMPNGGMTSLIPW